MLNCLEEAWPAEACTTLAVGDYLLHAEQWYAGHDGVGVVVAHPNEGPSFVSPTCAGFLPAVGMNSSGFAQGIDSLEATDDRIGIPRVLVSRSALGAPGMGVAIEAARVDGRAGGYAHVLASPDRRVVVETSATRDHITQNCEAHTNHYLSTSFGDVNHAPSGGSQDRLGRARHLVEFEPPKSLEDCVRILSDHEGGEQTICLHEEDRLGAGATVFGMACDVRTGCLIVSDGPPCAGKWLEFEVPNYDSAGLVGAG
jgi:Acyl-coenzyme A:6-aminopenicillanic acid acyl-transferase